MTSSIRTASPLGELDSRRIFCHLSPLDGITRTSEFDNTSGFAQQKHYTEKVSKNATENINWNGNSIVKCDENFSLQKLHQSTTVDSSNDVVTEGKLQSGGKIDGNGETAKPAKRKPGRPPGRSKKPRLALPNYPSTFNLSRPANGPLSLRAFFECGGRDYNEYLELTRNLKQTEPVITLRDFFERGGRDYNQYLELTKGLQKAQLENPQLLQSPSLLLTSLLLTPPPPPLTPITATSSHLPQSAPTVALAATAAVAGNRLDALHAADPESAAVAYTLATLHTMGCSSDKMVPGTSQFPPPPYHFNPCQQMTPQLTSNRLSPQLSQLTPDSTNASPPMFGQQVRRVTYKQSLVEDSHISVDCPIDYSAGDSLLLGSCQPIDLSVKTVRKADKPAPAENGTVDMTSHFIEKPTTRLLHKSVDWQSISVDDVAEFVSSIPDCSEYAETFKQHRIDGTILPLLSEDHLLNVMHIKLGPVIKLRQAISRLVTSLLPTGNPSQ